MRNCFILAFAGIFTCWGTYALLTSGIATSTAAKAAAGAATARGAATVKPVVTKTWDTAGSWISGIRSNTEAVGNALTLAFSHKLKYDASGSIILTFNAGSPATWNGLVTKARMPAGTMVTAQVRTSANDATWSAWSPVSQAAISQYLQIRVKLSTAVPATAPSLGRVALTFSPSGEVTGENSMAAEWAAATKLPAAINPAVVTKVPAAAKAPAAAAPTARIPVRTAKPPTSASLCSPTTTSLAIHVCDGQLVSGSGQAVQLRGVNVTGTEDACAQDAGFSWGSNNNKAEVKTSVAALLSWNINAVRVPLNEDCWLGINGVPAAYSGTNYQNNIMAWVTALNNAGIYTILDLQAAGSGSEDATYPNNWPMADADHSITFWSQVASAYKSNPAVLYDLYNEPFIGRGSPTTSNWNCWLNGCSDQADAPAAAADYNMAGMRQLLNAVRSAGADQPVMVAGLNWETNPCGYDGDSSQACPQLSYMPKDTLSPAQLVMSWHTYGQETGTCITVSCWNNLASTMKAAAIPVVTGEFGDSNDTTGGCSYVQPFMNWADQQSPKIGYLAWAWQAGGQSAGVFDLIANWAGSPSSMSDGGPVIKSHLLGQGNLPC